MAAPYLLTSVSPHREHYDINEYEAAEHAGFIVQQVTLPDVLNGNAPLQHATAFMRHYATEQWMFRKYARDNGIVSLIPDYELANDWFKFVPHDWQASKWLQR